MNVKYIILLLYKRENNIKMSDSNCDNGTTADRGEWWLCTRHCDRVTSISVFNNFVCLSKEINFNLNAFKVHACEPLQQLRVLFEKN